MARIIVVTSGKGGVGKTTSSAAIATGLAQKGKKTVVIDFDIGLRNLDLIMGCERRRSDAEPHYLPQLRKDILEVICKYVQIDPEMVTVQLEQKDGDISILELNVTLPEAEELK